MIYLVDTGKIVSLRFPTFWFEPTPQGLFMLQVAFGQSKYYSDNLVENINRGIRQKLRRGEWLTKAPFDGDIPKENYLAKKEELLKQKVSLANDLEDFGRTGNNWLQPLRAWILDANKAEKLSTSDSFPEIKAFVQKIGTNPVLLDKSVSVSFGAPWDFAALRKTQSGLAERRSREADKLKNPLNRVMWTHRESNPALIHAMDA